MAQAKALMIVEVELQLIRSHHDYFSAVEN